ncbi:alpha/beta fold hydrolase [Roseomonas sp. NAR14]|uniref:Alpha/beta fold hydrolase n=1 Tax=Roseomonas acroporae TaxID=2937791 RepID=A0A9X1Y9Y1_9PROT|nr:alpha/beta fold hydrolase [Roseomonas acroporae]MCK8785785.1 alpha/beta fold hydrolase [Roseomonas acroporae]
MRLNMVEFGAGAGDAVPLVLLHGLFGMAANFGQVQKRLAARRRVLAFDLRNHGHSPHASAMDYPTMAEDVAESMAAAGVGQAAVLGHSMGGKVAMSLALAHPGRVARLLVADIAPVPYRPTFGAYAEAMRRIPLRPGLNRREASAALESAVPEAGVRAFLLQGMRFDTDPPQWRIGLDEIAGAIPSIVDVAPVPPGARYEGPTLFLRGERSDYVRARDHEAIRALFPNAAFETLPGAGHWLHAENPDGFVAAVERFLDAG